MKSLFIIPYVVVMPDFQVKFIDIDPKDAIFIDKSVTNITTTAKYKITNKFTSKTVDNILKCNDVVSKNQIGLSDNLMSLLNVKEGDTVSLISIIRSGSSDTYSIIKKRLFSETSYTKLELDKIISDIISGSLTPLEQTTFLVSQIYQKWSHEEVEFLTRSITETGQQMEWPKDTVICDKHSLGGVPGNKVTLLITPIIAASGLLIPKTSSRAITSPSGTADTMEALGAVIEFTPDEVIEITEKVNGMIAWTGGLNLVPADAKLIEMVQRPLSIDPEPMMLASIMSKKLAMGVKSLVMDIPCGKGTKVETLDEAKRIAHRLSELGSRLGIRLESGITYGSSPVGHSIGPGLEAREALQSLQDPTKAPKSLVNKSCSLAGILLEINGKAGHGRGKDVARELLFSGKAYSKFKEILEAQSADPNLQPDDIEIGSYIYEYIAQSDGWVVEINNKSIVRAAKAVGCPKDKAAGVYFVKKKESIKRGDVVFRLHANSETKLEAGISVLTRIPPITIEGMLLGRE